MIGNPTEPDFVGVVREKLIANCPVTVPISRMLIGFLVPILLT
jgi:hypothetical protein